MNNNREIVKKMFLSEGIYEPLAENKKAQKLKKRGKIARRRYGKVKLKDAAVSGTRYTVDEKEVNADGRTFDENGNLFCGPLQGARSFDFRFTGRNYWRVSRKRSSKRLSKTERKLVELGSLTSRDVSEKATQILKEIQPAYLSRFVAAEDEQNDAISDQMYSKLDRMVDRWIQYQLKPRRGRPPGSKNKNPKINIPKIEKFVSDYAFSEGQAPNQALVVERFQNKWCERTLRNFIKRTLKMNWKQFCARAIES